MTELLKEEGCTPDLVERLRTMTAMINMGEKVSMVYETELRHRAAAEIERLRNENGNLRHNCAVAKIGHDQLNRFIRMLVGVGAPTSMPIDAQVEWACKEIERLRTKLAEAERIVSPAECDENCDDPDCPYSHVPLTRQAAYENSASRMKDAETRAELAEAQLSHLEMANLFNDERARAAEKRLAETE